MTAVVLTERRGAALQLTINRPERRNSLNNEVLALISAGIREAGGDRSIRAIVLTGAGDKAFSAGGDMAPDGGFGIDFSEPHTPYSDLLRAARECCLPIIVAVNGHCLAGGMGLLAMADVAVSVPDARFGLPEVRVGLFPMQVMSLLRRLVRPRKIAEWSLTGELFDARTALAEGLLNDVVATERLDARVESLVQSFAAASPSAIRRGKYALRALEDMSVEQAIAFAEGQIGLMTLTGDAREGLAAFNEKRQPCFRGD